MPIHRLNVFWAAFVIRIRTGLQYRVPAIAGMCTQFFWGWMLIMIYTAFYGSTYQNTESLSRATSYVWLQQAFLHAIALWIVDHDLAETIRSGQIAYELTRPRDLYIFWMAKLLGTRVSAVVLRFPLVILFASLMPAAYRLSAPASASALFIFALSLILGMVLTVAYMLVAYVTLFYVLSSDGVMWAFSVAAQFLAGQFVPLFFMPDTVQRVLYTLPFAYAGDFAFRVYTGEYGMVFALRGLCVQLCWIVALVALGRRLLRGAIRRTVAQGG